MKPKEIEDMVHSVINMNIDSPFMLTTAELMAYTVLVIEKIAKNMKRRGYHATFDELMAEAKKLKP